MSILTGSQIPLYRYKVLAKGIQLEMKGLRVNRGSSCYAIVKREFGFKGNKAKVLSQLQDYIADTEAL